ncbi:MAG TPA: hypothetical protein VL068_05400 [Microthrixaceae bacterium]|nr:hypothetical protein [Microthrixaceae bacterium]
MSERIQYFLLVFDHTAGHLIETEEYGEDSDKAVEAYAATEATFGSRTDIEVVLVGSDSLETVKRTHPNYFDGKVPVSKYLAGI